MVFPKLHVDSSADMTILEASLFTSDREIWQLIDLSSDGAILSNFCLYLFICVYDLKVLSDKVMSGQSADQVSLFLKAVNHYLKHILLPVTLLESAEEKEWSYGFFHKRMCRMWWSMACPHATIYCRRPHY